MTGSKHNMEGNGNDSGEPDPGPYWRRMHRDWRFWIGAVFMAAALAIYVLSGDLAWSQMAIGNPHAGECCKLSLALPAVSIRRYSGGRALHSQKHLLKIETFDGERWA